MIPYRHEIVFRQSGLMAYRVKKMKKIAATFILVGGLLVLAWWMAADSRTPRERELAAVLKPLLKPAGGSFWSEDEEQPEGWCEPANRQAVKDFVTKYPGTEEAYQAEVWLAMAGAYSERSPYWSVEKRRQDEVVKRLSVIGHTTAQAGTEKMAELERAFRLFQIADDARSDEAGAAEFERQAEGIFNHIKEYESEQDKVFLHYLKVLDMKPAEIEPTLRYLVAYETGYHDRGRQLRLARELKQKFPRYDPPGVNSMIEILELEQKGWTLANSVRGSGRN